MPRSTTAILHVAAVVGVTAGGWSGAASAQVTELEPITIEGGGEKADGPVDGLVAERSATGTRTDTPLIRTPQSISMVPADELEARAVGTTAEALRYSPGVAPESFGADPRADWIRLRGFIVPEYLDGMRLPRATYAWPRVDPYMLERIEVLRGPAGSLYGQTPPGGLISMVSKKPTATRFGEVELEFGDPARAQISADTGGPLNAEGTLSWRLAARARKAETNVDYVDNDRRVFAPALTWQPTPQTELTLLGHYIADDGGSLQFLPSQGVAVDSPVGEIPRDFFTGEPDFDDFERRQKALGYLFEHEFANGLTLSHKLRWGEVDYDLYVVCDFGLAPGSDRELFRRGVHIADRSEAWTSDTHLSFALSTGAVEHNLLAGIDVIDQDADHGFAVGSVAPLDIYDPEYGAEVGPLTTTIDSTQSLRQTGLYLQDQLSWDNFELVLSARKDWYETTSFDHLSDTESEAEGNELTGRAGLLYAFDNGLSPYISYATSFEPLIGVDTETGDAFEPTEGKQTEIGVKYQPPGRDALFTLAAFDLSQENTPVYDGAVTRQIGETEVRGVEAEARVELASGLSLIASYAYLDSEIRSGSPETEGNRVPYVAKNQASLWASYDFERGALDGLTLNGGVRFYGSSYGDEGNTVETDGYTLLDAGARYDLGARNPAYEGLTVSLNVANLLDEEYVSTCNDDATCYWGSGRTIRGGIDYRW